MTTTAAAAILAAQLPAAELLTLSNDGNRYEPAQGELITMPTPGFRHTVVAAHHRAGGGTAGLQNRIDKSRRSSGIFGATPPDKAVSRRPHFTGVPVTCVPVTGLIRRRIMPLH